MRVLYVAYRLPYPPDKGERIRSFAQIRHLARHAEVHVVCPVSSAPAAQTLDALRQHGVSSITTVLDGAWAGRTREVCRLLAGAPRMAGTFDSARLRAAVREIARRHDVNRLLVSTVHVAATVQDVAGVPKVLDLVDVYSELWAAVSERQRLPAAWLSRLEARRLRRLEARLAREFDRLVVASAAEAALFRARVADVPVEVVGNGVDAEYFRPAADAAPAEPASVVLTGTMDYAPNVDAACFFAREVLPRLRARLPDLRFRIVGRNPTRAVRALAAERGVEVTGSVADVRPYLAAAAAAVAPLRVARGIQNKVLEAMAMGVPVVATSAALAGLAADPADGARRADDADAFVREVHALVTDPAWRRRCAAAARAHVERHHRWQDHGARLLAVLREAEMPA